MNQYNFGDTCNFYSNITPIAIRAQTIEVYADEQADIEAHIEEALASLNLSPVTMHNFPNPYSNSDVERGEILKPWKDFSENIHGAARQLP